MVRFARWAAALVCVCVAFNAAHPLAAQATGQQPRLVEVPGLGQVYVLEVIDPDPRALVRPINVPGYGTVYILPVKPLDTRTSRQACIDEEFERFRGAPSQLERRAIDLKCSQR